MRQAGIRFALQLNVGTRETGLQHLDRPSKFHEWDAEDGVRPENWQESLRIFSISIVLVDLPII